MKDRSCKKVSSAMILFPTVVIVEPALQLNLADALGRHFPMLDVHKVQLAILYMCTMVLCMQTKSEGYLCIADSIPLINPLK